MRAALMPPRAEHLLRAHVLHVTAALILATTLFMWGRRRLPWLMHKLIDLTINAKAQRTPEVARASDTHASEAARARHTDLVLLGHHVANRLVDAGACPANSGLARIWRTQIVPLAVEGHCSWSLGMTAAITGLTSPAGAKFNGRVGRISDSAADGRWELLVRGPDGVGTANIKPANLRAATDLGEILAAWREIPNRSQQAPTPKTDQRALRAVALRDGPNLRALVHGGADLCTVDERGRTALHLALETLASSGDEDSDEETEATSAQVGKEDRSLQGLADRAAAEPPPRTDEMEMVCQLLAVSGEHIDARDRQGRTPLLVAVRMGHHEAARELLRAGADAGASDFQGNGLHHATMRRDTLMLRMLLGEEARSKGGLDVNGRGGKDGWTPLGLATRSGDLVTAGALLDLGADPHLVMFRGKSALDIARANAREGMVALLEERGSCRGTNPGIERSREPDTSNACVQCDPVPARRN